MSQAGELPRSDVLARLRRVQPAIAALSAPAGYGKSTLVRQWLADRSAVFCDCRQASDALRIARALVPEIAPELEDGGSTIAERMERAMAVWQAAQGRVAVFEHLDELAANDAALAAIAHFIGERPQGAQIVLVSRASLPFVLTRFAAPHEICMLRARDLAFDERDLAALLDRKRGDAAVTAAMGVTEGWPLAALLVKRLDAEARLDDILGRLDVIAAEELHEYLRDEVFAGFDAEFARALAFCVALPQPTLHDLERVSSDRAMAQRVAAYAVESPFVTRATDGVITVHPIVAAYMRERLPQNGVVLMRDVALRCVEHAEYVRAAELLAECGDRFEAARTLAMQELLDVRTLPRGYLKVLGRFEPSLVQRYPRLWGIATLVRMFRGDLQELVDEADLVWHTLAPDASVHERYYVFVFRVALLLAVGRIAEALDCVDAMYSDAAESTVCDERLRRRLLSQRGIVRARAGRLAEAQGDLRASLGHADEQDLVASGAYLALAAEIARARGENALERQLLDRAIEHAERARLENYLAYPLAEALAGAWLAGEVHRQHALLERLETLVAHGDIEGLRAFTAAARGREFAPSGADLPRFAFFGRLMLLEHVREDEERERLVRELVASARTLGSPLLVVFAAVAEAVCCDDRRDAALERAHSAAAQLDAPALREAVAAVRAGAVHLGMLAPLVARIDPSGTRRAPLLDIDVLSASVRVEGRSMRLSGRELELLTLIASRREGVTRARLAAQLWPEVDDADARNALGVLLHRLRSHLGRADLIERDGDAYRLSRDARVDLWEIERAATRAGSSAALGDGERARLERALQAFPQRVAESVDAWEWFVPLRRGIDDARNRIFVRLASDAISQRRYDDALAHARSALACDPCDESACEVAIRAHLLREERGEALRVFRTYREALQRELGAEPSAALAKLVTS